MHMECIGRKSVMIDTTTPKIMDFSYRIFADSADTVHLLNYPDSDNSPGHYNLLVTEEKQEGQPKGLPKAGIYEIIRVGKQRWYTGLVLNVDTDANDVGVKFMYPSAKQNNTLSFGNGGLVWCTSKNIILVCKVPTCDNTEVYPFNDHIVRTIEQYMQYKDTRSWIKEQKQKQKLYSMHGGCSIVYYQLYTVNRLTF